MGSINLLGNMANTQGPAVLPSSAASLIPNAVKTPAMGVQAKSPTTNISGPATTLPQSQVVNTSSFTPQQQALFTQAASLGSGVQTQNGVVGGSTGNTAQTNVAANTGASGAAAGSSSDPYVQNSQGQWVLQSSLPAGSTTGGNTDPVTSIPASSVAAAQNTANTPTTSTSAATGTTGASPTTAPGFTGLLGQLAAAPSPAVQQANQNILQTQNNLANALGGIGTEPIPLEFQQGRQAVVANTGAQELGYQQTALQNALTQQGQQITAAQDGGQLTSNLVQSPYGTPLVNPATNTTYSGGQVIGGGALGAAAGSTAGTAATPVGGIQPNDPAYPALQQYAALVASGSMAATAVPTFGSNPVTLAQLNSMAQQINPNYNPLTTPLNTSTQANTNASIGASNSTAAAGVQQAISRIANVQSGYQNFLSQFGLNASSSTLLNSLMNTQLSQTQAAGAEAGLKLLTSEMQSATSQLLGTPGVTPTDFTSQLQSFDPGNLSPAELTQYFASLNTAGEYQLNSYQTTGAAAYGSNGANPVAPVTPYSGTPTPITPPSPIAVPQTESQLFAQQEAAANNAPNPIKYAEGGVLSALGSASNVVSAVAGWAASLF